MLKSGLNHPKMARLATLLGEEITTARGIMESIWHMTAELAPGGNIGKFTDEEILAALHWRGAHQAITAAQLITALTDVRFLDPHPEYRLVCHDWATHCDDYVHMKLAKATLYFCDGSMPRLKRFAQSVRPEIEKRYAATKTSTHKPAEQSATFEHFRSLYPRKRHKNRALGEWNKLDPELHQQIIHALEAQIAIGMLQKDTQYQPFPNNWLKARAWEDQLEASQEAEAEADAPPLEDRDPADNPDDVAVALGLHRND